MKDLSICSACFFFETSSKLHMPRYLKAFTDWIYWVKTRLNNMRTCVILFTFSYFFFISSNITLLKKIRRNIYHFWPMFHISFRGHVSTVLLYLDLVSSVYPDENHWTVVRLDLPPGTSLVLLNRFVFMQSQQ